MSGDNTDQEPDYLPGSQDPKVTDGEIYEQLIASDGNKAHAARELHMSRSRLSARIDRSVVLTSLLNDMVEGIVDQAEQNVYADVRKNDATANRFVLTTRGKSRGWASGVEGTGKGGEIVVQINRLAGD
jgi:hypothetical protein